MNKIKVYKLVRIFLLIAIVIILSLIIRKYYISSKTEKKAKEVVSTIKEELNNFQNVGGTEEIRTELNGYKVIGIIKIPKIDLEYPILETTNEESLNFSITKFWGNKINAIGNITLAGHNNLSGTMFGKLNKLQEGDIIELTDMQNVTLKYEVFKTYVIDPNDISCILQEQEGVREITLITCENGNNNRYIVKAREIQN